MSNDLEFIHEFPGASAKNDSNTDDGKLPSIQWTDDSDDALLTADLIAFIREFSTCSMFLFLGGRVSKGQEKSSSDLSLKRGYSSEIITTWIPQNSQLKLQFPCISSILEVHYLHYFHFILPDCRRGGFLVLSRQSSHHPTLTQI